MFVMHWPYMLRPRSHFFPHILRPFPNFGNGMKKSFPIFGNGNGRPIFPGMVGNGNSCPSLVSNQQHLPMGDLICGQPLMMMMMKMMMMMMLHQLLINSAAAAAPESVQFMLQWSLFSLLLNTI